MSSRIEPKLSQVLAVGVLEPGLRCADLDEALRRLLAPLLADIGMTPDGVAAVLDAVQTRERVASTLVGPVSLPHARVPGLKHLVAGLGVNRGGVYEKSAEPSFVLAFASPAQAAADHLRFLARAAQLFRDEDARAHLLLAEDRAGMLETLRRVER